MRINGKDVLRSEFEYSYNRDKSLLALKHATPGKYVEHFVNFKLKVGDAEAAGLDTAFAFREEVENYRARLVESYLTDTVEADAAARRWYDRMKLIIVEDRYVCAIFSNIFLRMFPVMRFAMRLPVWTPFMSIFGKIRETMLLTLV